MVARLGAQVFHLNVKFASRLSWKAYMYNIAVNSDPGILMQIFVLNFTPSAKVHVGLIPA